MQLTDFFDAAILLSDGPRTPGRIGERLRASACRTWVADLTDAAGWRAAMVAALAHAHACEAAGVLVLLPQQRQDDTLWISQDALVEHLADRPWDIVYLGHGEGPRVLRPGDRPGLLHCDLPPSDVSAMAVSCEVLQALIDDMPERAVDGPLTAADWMAIACWLAQARVRNATGWAAWPPLARARDSAPAAFH